MCFLCFSGFVGINQASQRAPVSFFTNLLNTEPTELSDLMISYENMYSMVLSVNTVVMVQKTTVASTKQDAILSQTSSLVD